MRRRDFLVRAAETVLVLPFGTFLVHCGGAEGGETTTEASLTEPPEEEVPYAPARVVGDRIVYTSSHDNAHAHSFSIALATFDAHPSPGVSVSTSEAELHTHAVTISEAQIRAAGEGHVVTVETREELLHTHVFRILRVG